MDKMVCVGWCDADDVVNYGQILQGCSMMTILRCFFPGRIDYLSYLPRDLLHRIYYIKGHVNFVNGHLQSYISTKRFINRFERENNVSLYQVSSFNRLNKLCKNVDFLVCGSDQIWHPLNFDDGYFLAFDNVNSRRISFAASIPKRSMELAFKEQFFKMRNCIKKIDYISVREPSSVELITKLSGRVDVTTVLDPTMLISANEWKRLEKSFVCNEKYIFVYIPNGINDTLKNIINKAKQIYKVDTILVLYTRGSRSQLDYKQIKFVSVGQFIYLINHAEAIVTSSFHAAVFSLLFHKELWCYDVPNDIRGEDYRLYDLLTRFDADGRLITSDKEIDTIQAIDYDHFERILIEKKKQSLDFLKHSLEL